MRLSLIHIYDGVDSAQGDNDFAPLRNIFNEWLVRDTSKKIKAVKRSKGMSGKQMCIRDSDKAEILAYRKDDYQWNVLVADKEKARRKYKNAVVDDATIDDILLRCV